MIFKADPSLSLPLAFSARRKACRSLAHMVEARESIGDGFGRHSCAQCYEQPEQFLPIIDFDGPRSWHRVMSVGEVYREVQGEACKSMGDICHFCIS